MAETTVRKLNSNKNRDGCIWWVKRTPVRGVIPGPCEKQAAEA
ncbi:MAG: hypothetical protein ACTTJH_06055 [Bacteroidales bacterium]